MGDGISLNNWVDLMKWQNTDGSGATLGNLPTLAPGSYKFNTTLNTSGSPYVIPDIPGIATRPAFNPADMSQLNWGTNNSVSSNNLLDDQLKQAWINRLNDKGPAWAEPFGGMQGLGTIGTLGLGAFQAWNAYKGTQAAKEANRINRDVARTNIANQAATLEDDARRMAQSFAPEGSTASERQAIGDKRVKDLGLSRYL